MKRREGEDGGEEREGREGREGELEKKGREGGGVMERKTLRVIRTFENQVQLMMITAAWQTPRHTKCYRG